MSASFVVDKIEIGEHSIHGSTSKELPPDYDEIMDKMLKAENGTVGEYHQALLKKSTNSKCHIFSNAMIRAPLLYLGMPSLEALPTVSTGSSANRRLNEVKNNQQNDDEIKVFRRKNAAEHNNLAKIYEGEANSNSNIRRREYDIITTEIDEEGVIYEDSEISNVDKNDTLGEMNFRRILNTLEKGTSVDGDRSSQILDKSDFDTFQAADIENESFSSTKENIFDIPFEILPELSKLLSFSANGKGPLISISSMTESRIQLKTAVNFTMPFPLKGKFPSLSIFLNKKDQINLSGNTSEIDMIEIEYTALSVYLKGRNFSPCSYMPSFSFENENEFSQAENIEPSLPKLFQSSKWFKYFRKDLKNPFTFSNNNFHQDIICPIQFDIDLVMENLGGAGETKDLISSLVGGC